tara:strand:+ start:7746 stop:7997 length:252 start_codon:yes stop_codon:yes gene_type:complete
MNNYKIPLIAGAIAILLNILLSYTLYPFASNEEIKPTNGPENLSFKSQIMHMLVHHKQVILTSSFIVGLLVTLSSLIALKYFN